MLTHDEINHPVHYTSHPSGVECIQVVEHFPFNIGAAIKYLWRAGLKGDKLADLRKAEWYCRREQERILRDGRKQVSAIHGTKAMDAPCKCDYHTWHPVDLEKGD